MEPNKDELIELGNNSEVLLKNPTFILTTNQLIEGTFANFVNTKPDETQKRESSYYHHRALMDIVATLQQRVAVRDQMLNETETEE